MEKIIQEGFPCKLGCEDEVFFEEIEFSDGYCYFLPRDSGTQKIHRCKQIVPEKEPVDYDDSNIEELMENSDGNYEPFSPNDTVFWYIDALGDQPNYYPYYQLSKIFSELFVRSNNKDLIDFKKHWHGENISLPLGSIERERRKNKFKSIINHLPIPYIIKNSKTKYSGCTFKIDDEPMPEDGLPLDINAPFLYNRQIEGLGKLYEEEQKYDDALLCYTIQDEITSDQENNIRYMILNTKLKQYKKDYVVGEFGHGYTAEQAGLEEKIKNSEGELLKIEKIEIGDDTDSNKEIAEVQKLLMDYLEAEFKAQKLSTRNYLKKNNRDLVEKITKYRESNKNSIFEDDGPELETLSFSDLLDIYWKLKSSKMEIKNILKVIISWRNRKSNSHPKRKKQESDYLYENFIIEACNLVRNELFNSLSNLSEK